ncbi:MAG: hypothetical protein FWE74_07190 [Oscillospiraceae bacterium]|nr:hypothetical protein [Oscillospiraceae bacterium]
MKKIVSSLLIAIMILSSALPAAASNITYSTSDAMTILRDVAGTMSLTPQQRTRFDLNNDGDITTADALIILRVVAGLQEAPEVTPTVSEGDFTVILNKPDYVRNETMQVTVSGLTQRDINIGATIAVYNSGAAHKDSLMTRTPPVGEGVIEIPAPSRNGVFELRLYSTGSPFREESFIMSITFTVGGAR